MNMIEPLFNSVRNTALTWSRRASIRVRDSVSDVDWSSYKGFAVRARVALVDNASAVGQSLQSLFRN